ncbi:deoxyribonuclease-1 [Sinobacterium caligoides]|uniref:Deoxyribonuclease-1 n=1 Tax=Sinobacterium caligoides TaxID=933926 RepID=A0A3N2DMF1_9GAMM|nr:endonuclease [Sinobacterium caligoides]ROS00973.1 deoxyribonuclease-1 [Sinobacterium caligoides]
MAGQKVVKPRVSLLSLIVVVFSVSTPLAMAGHGNTVNQSFNKAKKSLEREIYKRSAERRTIYCDAPFDSKKNIKLPKGFTTIKHRKRATRVEWEHVVPAENFGRSFSEWREGDAQCVNSKGKLFKGRKCASKMSEEYRYMQADMYNLYPAVGAVNATRSNYNFEMLPTINSRFGSCDMRINKRKVQPPEASRGVIARSYLYMEQAYPRYNMSRRQRQMMSAWDKQYPVTKWECERGRRIEQLQTNVNNILLSRCQALGI